MPQQAVLNVTEIAKASILAFNERNWEKVRNTISPGFVYEEVGTGRRAQGIDQVLTVWQGWATVMPDVKGTITREYTSGNTAVLELTWVGTHKGPLETPYGVIAPTGKRLEVRSCEIMEISGDKGISARHYFDMATILTQVGALK